tara:strand:+ start:6857 stop:8674 length:1818 start_codon:yes stop_codon:yes gene_type:complete
MIFTIPAGQVEYFNPVNTTLQLDCKIKLPAGKHPTRLQLDPQLGGSVLIQHLRIYGNSAEMPLLEELQDVNVLGALRYDYDKNDNICKKRALTEGCGIWDSRVRGEFGNQRRVGNGALASPFFTPNVSGSELVFDADGSNTGFRTAKLILPLHMSGIFGSSVVFPNLLVSGLRLEVTLCENRIPFRQIPSVMKNLQPEANPRFHSIDGLDARTGDWGTAVGDVSDTFFIDRTNNMLDAEHFPFCVGEAFSFLDTAVSVANEGPNSYMTWKDGTDGDIVPIIKSIKTNDTTSATRTRPLIEITLNVACRPSTAMVCQNTNDASGQWAMYSVSMSNKCGDVAVTTTYEPTYEISNCELLVEKVEMPSAYTSKMMDAMKQGGTINYDFLSFTNYKYSQLANDRVANIRVPIMNKRCKATLCIPTDASVLSTRDAIMCGNGEENSVAGETFTYHTHNEGNNQGYGGSVNEKLMGNHPNYSERTGLVGVADGITSYQFFYDGKLNPSRKVETTKISNRTSIAQQPLVELEKALSVSGINPHSFEKFQQNWCVGRAVGIQNGVTDLSTTDYNLQIEYQDSTNPPVKNKLWNIYIAHLRRLMIKGDSVMVDV